MSPEAQRIAIAEACGWHWYKYKTESGEYRVLQIFPYNQTKADMSEPVANHSYLWIHGDIPDYLSDLNAVHEAEKGLTDGQWDDYVAYLYGPSLDEKNLVHATAPQRCEALLRTLGKWQEPPTNKQ